MVQTVSYGLWLKQSRQALDLTQAMLADRTGCAVQTIRAFESGKRRPSREMAERLAEILRIAPEDRAAFLAAARLPASGRTPEEATGQEPPAVPAQQPEATTALPHFLTPLIGRTAEIAEIAGLLPSPHCRLVTLVGPGGIGKTRLAVEAARRAGPYRDGVVFVPLAAVSTAALLPAALADAVGLTLRGAATPGAQLLHYLHDKQMLLLLDNLEHLLDGIDLVVRILEVAPGITLLTTSRERLRLLGEWTVEVHGLPVPTRTTPGALGDAIQLFTDRARRVDRHFQLHMADHDAVARICRLVDGVPLAIELAASWVNVLSCREIAAELTRDLDLLQTPAHDVPSRQRSIRAVFDHSWSLLSETERDVLRKLAVFRGGMERDAAIQVAGATAPMLLALIDKSLVQRTGDDRYDLHPLVLQFAAEQLMASGDRAEAERAQRRWCLALAEAAEGHQWDPEQPAWVARLEANHDNIRIALGRKPEDEADAAQQLRLATALGWFWELRGYWLEGRTWLEATLRATHEGAGVGPAAQARALHALGTLVSRQGDVGRARLLLEQSVGLSRTASDSRGTAQALDMLGLVVCGQCEYEVATALLEEALLLDRAEDFEPGTAIALRNLGYVKYAEGDYPATQACFVESLMLWRKLGYKLGSGILLTNLGEVARCENDVDRAAAYYEEGLTLMRQLSYSVGIASVLHNLGQVAAMRHRYDEAVAAYSESLALHRKHGNRTGMIDCLAGLAGVAIGTGQPLHAVQLLSSVDMLLQAQGQELARADGLAYARNLAAVQSQLDAPAFARTWALGQLLDLEQAIEVALMVANAVPHTAAIARAG